MSALTVVAKVCLGPCGEGKLLEEFAVKSTGKHGRESWCRDCKNEHRRKAGVNTRRSDVSVKVHRTLRDEVRALAKEHGMRQGWLLNFLIASSIQALRDGRLEVPKR